LTSFAPIFVPERLREGTSDRGWLAAMLEAERALAVVEGRLGIIPADAPAAIAEGCREFLARVVDRYRASVCGPT
jgi:3-carboxy-cis,cis-muconate cycloisomerase